MKLLQKSHLFKWEENWGLVVLQLHRFSSLHHNNCISCLHSSHNDETVCPCALLLMLHVCALRWWLLLHFPKMTTTSYILKMHCEYWLQPFPLSKMPNLSVQVRKEDCSSPCVIRKGWDGAQSCDSTQGQHSFSSTHFHGKWGRWTFEFMPLD